MALASAVRVMATSAADFTQHEASAVAPCPKIHPRYKHHMAARSQPAARSKLYATLMRSIVEWSTGCRPPFKMAISATIAAVPRRVRFESLMFRPQVRQTGDGRVVLQVVRYALVKLQLCIYCGNKMTPTNSERNLPWYAGEREREREGDRGWMERTTRGGIFA